jgi:hypothetical protein
VRKRWEDLYAEDRIKKEKLKIMMKKNEIKRQSFESEECTFKPNLDGSKSPQKKHAFVATREIIEE